MKMERNHAYVVCGPTNGRQGPPQGSSASGDAVLKVHTEGRANGHQMASSTLKIVIPQCPIHLIDMCGSPGGTYCYKCDHEDQMRTAEAILELNLRRAVSQATGFICAKCGQRTSLDNRHRLPLRATVFGTANLVRIDFPCPKCDETYDLGFCAIEEIIP
jgi:hypothetical protein